MVAEGSDRPVAQAEVRMPGTSVAAKTDDAGHYSLTGLPPGQFDMAIEAPGYEPMQKREIVATGKNTVKLR